jgi:hypothetical protein
MREPERGVDPRAAGADDEAAALVRRDTWSARITSPNADRADAERDATRPSLATATADVAVDRATAAMWIVADGGGGGGGDARTAVERERNGDCAGTAANTGATSCVAGTGAVTVDGRGGAGFTMTGVATTDRAIDFATAAEPTPVGLLCSWGCFSP